MTKTTQTPTRPEGARAAEREAASHPPDRRPPEALTADRPAAPVVDAPHPVQPRRTAPAGAERTPLPPPPTENRPAPPADPGHPAQAENTTPTGTRRTPLPPAPTGNRPAPPDNAGHPAHAESATPARAEGAAVSARVRDAASGGVCVQDVPPVLPGPRLFGARVRGRHRRPRPRKVLFAVGGLALAAGALSLVRMVPGPGSGVPGTTEAEPREDVGGGVSDGATNAAATLPAALGVSPSATSVMGGASATPTTGPSPASGPVTSAAAPAPEAPTPPGTPATPDMTTIPQAPNTPAPSTAAPRPPATTPAAPHPGHGTSPSSPAPQPGEPGLCVPVVGLCAGPLGH
ncbi:hypothetical protein [Streptomyces sp. NPDC094149]|uniref:hypothetical protein n=1 Tax=Streptomyces sp. NPDC094149 TaxID=3155079 RepID=UPI003322CB4C